MPPRRFRSCGVSPRARSTLPPTANMLLHLLACATGVTVEWTQTARRDDGTLVLLEDMPPLEMVSAKDVNGPALIVDRSKVRYMMKQPHAKPSR